MFRERQGESKVCGAGTILQPMLGRDFATSTSPPNRQWIKAETQMETDKVKRILHESYAVAKLLHEYRTWVVMWETVMPMPRYCLAIP